ncbi:hypothetical protein [Peribacillus simplex]|uniref:hypothetical protein n=1 Tax=Peribacillus simplex TaxID=1478 RepID=UPI0024C1D065|nr:hypothetical protein [Peribacillus simplex]MDR4928128.1 hypothetical protein [Peribacillus simplex]WHX91861.1 hypothetical protein QNH50_02915 [Peribacillus simplex]
MAIELLMGYSEERPLGCDILENHKVWIKEEGNRKNPDSSNFPPDNVHNFFDLFVLERNFNILS